MALGLFVFLVNVGSAPCPTRVRLMLLKFVYEIVNEISWGNKWLSTDGCIVMGAPTD